MNDKNMKDNNFMEKVNFGNLPVGKAEDVEYSEELADAEDLKAAQRAAAADRRAQQQGE